ncbi:sugar phosphate isomerase/epimerase family protein [Salinispira pacifica]
MNISCNGASFVAQQVGYRMTGGWEQGDRTTNEYFSPDASFAQRFASLVTSIKNLGFSSLDLWTAQLNWAWANERHLAAAAQVLSDEGVRVTSYAGHFGNSPQELRSACRTIKAVGCNLLGGSTGLLRSDPETMVRVLEEEEVLFAFENHPGERSPGDVLTLIGGLSEDVVGTVVDTGWYATNGYPADRAIEELAPRLFLVHLKDVRAAGAHDTCGLTEGCAPIVECLQTLVRLGYEGTLSIEHEPEDRDPGPELAASREVVEGLLSRTS